MRGSTVEQEPAVAGTGFADRGDADRGLVGDRTLALADPAAGAERRVHIRLMQSDRLAVTFGDGDFPREDGLGRNRADFLADNTRGIHAPGQAAAMIVKCRAHPHGTLRGEVADSRLFFDRDPLDCSGRANLSTKRAVEFAIADLHVHDRRPDPLDPGSEDRGLKNIGRADADALVALDAAVEKFFLLNRPRGTNHLLAVVSIRVARGPAKPKKCSTEEDSKKCPAGGNGRRSDLMQERRQEFER